MKKINLPILLLSLKFQNCFSKRREGRSWLHRSVTLGSRIDERQWFSVFNIRVCRLYTQTIQSVKHFLLCSQTLILLPWKMYVSREAFDLKNKKRRSIYVYACHKQSLSSTMISTKFSGNNNKKISLLQVRHLQPPYDGLTSCQTPPFLKGSKHALLVLKTAFINASSNKNLNSRKRRKHVYVVQQIHNTLIRGLNTK
jgi:hypothetical protein